MNEFTKGPWKYVAWGQTVSINADNYHGIAHINPRGDHHNGIPARQDVDNARLIAAAGTAATKCAEMGYDGVKAIEALPDAIKALDEALNSFEWLDYHYPTHPGCCVRMERIEKIKSILAKARGKE